jgi:hypothetical protein
MQSFQRALNPLERRIMSLVEKPGTRSISKT